MCVVIRPTDRPGDADASPYGQSDPELATFDIYGEADAGALGLNPGLLERARAVHRVLAANAAPAHVRYFYFAAAGHRTPTRLNVFRNANGTVDASQTQLTRTADGGDGTVPMFSALPRLGQRHKATNEHATAFKGDAFRHVFVRLFGGDEGPALEAVAALAMAAAGLALSIEAPLVTAGQDIEVVLHAVGDADEPHGGFPEIKGELVLRKVRDGGAVVAEAVRRVPVAYAGPSLSRLRLYLDPIDAPGHYQLHFEGAPADAGPEAFAVCAPLPRRRA